MDPQRRHRNTKMGSNFKVLKFWVWVGCGGWKQRVDREDTQDERLEADEAVMMNSNRDKNINRITQERNTN